MALVTIDVKAAGIAQGGWNRGQAGSESNKCRCTDAIYIEASGIHPPTITSTLSVSTGKTVKVSLMTFETASHTTEILASGWQDIPYTLNISSSTASKYVLCEMRNSDTSNVTPDQITAWTITYDDGIAFKIGDSGYPEPIDAPEPTEHAMTAPYTDSVFRIDSAYNYGYPFTALMPEIPHSGGAFAGAADLAAVRIPISVKVIGSEAFKDTALQRVRIAADCTYGAESFPEGCVVTRYPDDRYEQLYDSAGKAVLDYDARRIYVLKEEPTNG